MEKAKIHVLKEMIEYVPLAVVTKTINQKTTGYIEIMALDKGKSTVGNISPFDTFVQVIEGSAEIIIDDKSNLIHQGQAIIIPAHLSRKFKSSGRCKMISMVIKNGYEEGII